MKPFFTYFGGKWRTAKSYPAPKFGTIVEPFAGSAGYAIRYFPLNVILNDKDPVIASVWNFLINASESDILSLPAKVEDVRGLNVCQEAKWLIGFWLNKGNASPCNVPGKWMRDHLAQGTRLNSYWGNGVKERIASQLRHIRHWKITNRNFDEMNVPHRSTWFIDPPYHASGSKYRHSKIDYPALARWVRYLPGQAIVCEQGDADWLPFKPFRETKSLEGKHGKKRSVEVFYEQ